MKLADRRLHYGSLYDTQKLTTSNISEGFVVSPFFGQSSRLMMEPPFVFVFSNYSLSYELLSKDRWECYEVIKATNLDVKKVNLKLKQAKESIKK